MTPIRVVNVRGLQGEDRAGVCYVGRRCAGWPGSPWGNPHRPAPGFDAVAAFREYAATCGDRWLADLWEACGRGEKPLGCWCVDATQGDGQAVVCHAQVLAEMLSEFQPAATGGPMNRPLFNPPDVDECHAEWKANCGPCALAAATRRTVASLRDLFPAFPGKAWCNPSNMREALSALGVTHATVGEAWPRKGLAFLQMEGPWLDPGVPVHVAYRHTHWVAVHHDGLGRCVYDTNARGWLTLREWEEEIVPHLIAHTPRATGWRVRTGVEFLSAVPSNPNPCGCGECNVCLMYAERKPVPVKQQPEGSTESPHPPKPTPKPRREATARTLFDGVDA